VAATKRLEAQRAGRSHDHAARRRHLFDAFARGELCIFDAERRVLALQQPFVLERTADADAELDDPQLHRDDPDQRKRQQPDPGAAADQAVK
jgi:hypothetical protein